MTVATLRGFDKDVERAIRRAAKSRNLSLNQAALEFIRAGAGLSGPDRASRSRDIVGDSLDDLIGCWKPDDERAFLEALAPFEAIDSELWK
jgi:hypothetical protein